MGFILFKNAIFLNTDNSNVSPVYNKDNSMTLTLSGTLYGLLLNEQQLTKKIAEVLGADLEINFISKAS